MATQDSIDDSTNLPIIDVASLLQDTLIYCSSNPCVVDVDDLISGSSSAHVVNIDAQTIPLTYSMNDGNDFPSTLATLPLGKPKPMPKWAISTIVNAAKFLSSPSKYYQEIFPPTSQALVTLVANFPLEFKDLPPQVTMEHSSCE